MTYAKFKDRLMNHYEELKNEEEYNESEDTDSNGEGSMDMDSDGDDDGVDERSGSQSVDTNDGYNSDDERFGSESVDTNDETSDSESLEIEGWKTQEKDGVEKSEKGGEEDLRKDRFFDFIFKAENYFDKKSLEKMEKYEDRAEEELRWEKSGLMDRKFLRDLINLLNIKHKGKDKLLHMKFCSDDCIHAIS